VPKSYTLFLKAFKAEGKIKVIKEVKGLLNLGLKEAKD
jgi:ribosomal protein L7/L12